MRRYIEFRRHHGLSKPSILWKYVREWSQIVRKDFSREVILELQFKGK